MLWQDTMCFPDIRGGAAATHSIRLQWKILQFREKKVVIVRNSLPVDVSVVAP